jgi:hypothetical protein
MELANIGRPVMILAASSCNSLNPSLRNMESIAKFKTELRKQKDNRQVPKHFKIGPRKLIIALTQLRCFASFLDTWVHYYFEYYKTFVIFSFFFFLSMIPSLTLYTLEWN